MAISPRGRLDFSAAVYIHHYFAKIKADFAAYVILLMP
jgi:hypothetical protein